MISDLFAIEITGVSETLLKPQDIAIEIEMAGLKNSLNVAVAFGVVAYHIRQSLWSQAVGLKNVEGQKS